MQKEFVTKNSRETQALGKMLAQEIEGGEVICLVGELGAGKTTFTQGLLKGLKVEGPYTSPTFVIMKHYKVKSQKSKVKSATEKSKVKNIYHIDAYRVGKEDILSLGWKEITDDKKNVIIVEWADRISDIIPKRSLWIDFCWMDENKRKILLSGSFQKSKFKDQGLKMTT